MLNVVKISLRITSAPIPLLSATNPFTSLPVVSTLFGHVNYASPEAEQKLLHLSIPRLFSWIVLFSVFHLLVVPLEQINNLYKYCSGFLREDNESGNHLTRT